MNIVIATDSFKESLSSFEAGNAIKRGLQRVLKNVLIKVIPVADGGEGTVEALVKATNGKIISVEVHDPLMRKINSFYGITGDSKTAIIEMAAASGLPLLKEKERNPLITTSFGTGELINYVLDRGCKKIIMGIGGSATNDGGIGMIAALGAVISGKTGKPIKLYGSELGRIEDIDYSKLKEKTKGITFLVATDVTNPLTGANGASFIFSPQKGADNKMVEILEENMLHYSNVLKRMFGKDYSSIPGSGAAGGLGAALMAFMGAELKPGFEVVSKMSDLESKIKKADLVITGEGKIDYQTRFGKTPYGVAKLAKKYSKPVIAVAGTLGEKWNTLYDVFDLMLSITDKPMSLEEAVENASDLCENTGELIGRMKLV